MKRVYEPVTAAEEEDAGNIKPVLYLSRNFLIPKKDCRSLDFAKSYEERMHARSAKISLAEKFRNGACENCGANTHSRKYCMERPRKVPAKFSHKCIARDDNIEKTLLTDYAAKRDPTKGYNFDSHTRRSAKKFEANEALEGTLAESNQRNPRDREDIAKYLSHGSSAHYDPKTRSMRADPLPDADPT